MTQPKQLCEAFVFSRPKKPVRSCTYPAKYRYQPGRFRVEYLCGIHARRVKGSVNLTALERTNDATDGG